MYGIKTLSKMLRLFAFCTAASALRPRAAGAGFVWQTRASASSFHAHRAAAHASHLLRTRGGSTRMASGGAAVGEVGVADGRLPALRAEMAAAGVDALLIPSSDAHLSEYVHPHYERRAFISSFTGSAGTVLVTSDSALLWTDGRYFLQAEEELGPEWTLMRDGQPGVPKLAAYLASELPEGAALGIDPFLHSLKEAEGIREALANAARSLKLVSLTDGNLVDRVWDATHTRPPPPDSPARALALEVAGVSREVKLAAAAAAAKDAKAVALLVCALDEVAWLFNLRAADVPCCPVLQAYAIVHAPPTAVRRLADAPPGADTSAGGSVRATLFVDSSKLSSELISELSAAGVTVRDYEDTASAVESLRSSGGVIAFDPSLTNFALVGAAGDKGLEVTSPLALPKSIKNEAELAGMLEAHLTDGAALATFFGWLEQAVASGSLPTPFTEATLAATVDGFRGKQAGFLEVSFPTIAGTGPNGAVIHYNPQVARAPRTFDGTEMLLLDSGGQYACGTTDVTRTVHLGTPSEWQKECFTRVLKGNIGLDSTVFPEVPSNP